MSIEIHNVTKTFGSFYALNDVSLHVKTGELLALLGPSGSGKTTLLRIIAGLEGADAGSGSVRFMNQDVTGRSVGARGVGFVFQHYALFRHMTVFENIAFGLKVRPWRLRPSKRDIRDKVMELLRLVQLDSLADRYPSQLSGGQRQRVALARALAVEPKVLLLDEPFGALDAKVRRELRRWLRKLHDEVHITSVFVTHDQEEALEVSDRIAVMNNGKIEQLGTPEDVYEHPATPFVYNFLGNVNLFHARVQGDRLTVGEGEIAAGNADAGAAVTAVGDGAAAVAYVRPHDLEITRHGNGQSILARIDHISAAGPVVQVQLLRKDIATPLDAAISRERYRELKLKAGEEVYVTPKNVRVFVEDYSI